MKIQRLIQQHTTAITAASAILLVGAGVSHYLNWPGASQLFLFIASIIGAIPIFIRAYQAAKVKVISIELLVSIAVIGAFLIGEYNESAIVTFLFLFGSFLEKKTLDRTRSSIKALTQMSPTKAFIFKNGETIETPIDEVEAGDLILVKTGGQIPVDGTILDGNGYLNEASITGESQVVKKNPEDHVYAGTLLDNGTLKIRADKVGEDTTFGKLIELVEEAQDSQSAAERFIDQFSKYYTPFVLVIALIVGLLTQDLPLAITILVLGCPGALVIGVPVSNVAGIGNGAKHGVLIKGGEVMSRFSKVDTFVFDKTGTLTTGETSVAQAIHLTGDSDAILAMAASVEAESDHPLGKAVVAYAKQQGAAFLPVTKTEVIKGKGLKAEVAGRELLIGNQALLAETIQITKEQDAKIKEIQNLGSSVVLIAVDNIFSMILGIADTPRPEAQAALRQLKKMGAKKTVMLTGDNERTAFAVGEQLGIDEIHAGLLPEDKIQQIKQLQAEGTVAFIGDGINDGPALAAADIGIAMGSGTDVAIETSAIVLMKSTFKELVHAYGLTKKTVLNMKENIVIAVLTVLFLLVGLIFGYIYMASGMFVHEASILVVIFNGMRLLKYSSKS